VHGIERVANIIHASNIIIVPERKKFNFFLLPNFGK